METIKSIKITKRSHACKDHAGIYNGEIFNSFNPDLQLKDTESTTENKLIDLLYDLRGF